MSPGSSTESYPVFARIGLRENPGKTLNQVTCPDRDSNPGHLVSQPDALTVTPQSLMLAGNEFQSLGRAYVKEDEYEEVRWDGIVNIVSWRERVFRLWWEERRLRWAGHVARMDESRNAYRVLVGRPEGIRPLGRPRRRWEDNIKMDLREVSYDGRDWINLAQDRDEGGLICCLVNCPKTGLNLTSDIKKAPLMRQLDQEIMDRMASSFPPPLHTSPTSYILR
ncbi:hypothetical protein ANN_21987 [Periplaneta americana]|uniref:Uncharacterized protein n=1 Tax=Periplaneta americana TaxID=6978 RepID=A0ABQ8S757_PERAM|nr:hypothetical protein ANN_21987 [Periplaneta americana]